MASILFSSRNVTPIRQQGSKAMWWWLLARLQGSAYIAVDAAARLLAALVIALGGQAGEALLTKALNVVVAVTKRDHDDRPLSANGRSVMRFMLALIAELPGSVPSAAASSSGAASSSPQEAGGPAADALAFRSVVPRPSLQWCSISAQPADHDVLHGHGQQVELAATLEQHHHSHGVVLFSHLGPSL
jgi:hypothetical protein